jgi:hypothetical protein
LEAIALEAWLRFDCNAIAAFREKSMKQRRPGIGRRWKWTSSICVRIADALAVGSTASGDIEAAQRQLFQQPVVKVEISEMHPSGAKARRALSAICGTTKVVPFQNMTKARRVLSAIYGTAKSLFVDWLMK